MKWLFVLGLGVSTAEAVPPVDLESLVDEAFARDPEAAALALDARAAQLRAEAALRPRDPQLMLGAQNLGTPNDSPNPAMYMIEVSQSLRGWGEARAGARREALEGDRATAELALVRADLRLRLWQAVARVDGLQQELGLIDEQLSASRALMAMVLRRYSSGAAGAGGAMGGMPESGVSGAMAGEAGGAWSQVEVPRSSAPSTSRGSGMGGMGGMSGGRPAGAGMSGPDTGGLMEGGMAGTGGGSEAMIRAAGGVGLASILRLDVEVGRLAADRAAVDARLTGERQLFEIYLGSDVADAVFDNPAGFYGPEGVLGGPRPEVALAEIAREAAEADVEVQRAIRRPDVMLSFGQSLMAPGMYGGTNVSIGLDLPMWGTHVRQIGAATAGAQAAAEREARVARDLSLAVAATRAAVDAAGARATVLSEVAVPRARSAFEATATLFGSGRATAEEAVRAWEELLAVQREMIEAKREVQLRSAELARVEGR